MRVYLGVASENSSSKTAGNYQVGSHSIDGLRGILKTVVYIMHN